MSDDELIEYKDNKIKKTRKTRKTTSTAHFKDFLLRDELNEVLKDLAFEYPSEVQQLAIPKCILGQDILCQAKSGTGKTAVFVLSTLQQLRLIEKETCIVVLVHTKEMAEQVKQEYLRFSTKMDITVYAVYGGVPFEEDLKKVSKASPTVLVGTPGRMQELVSKRGINLRHVQFFVMDECDKLVEVLDMRRGVQEVFVNTPRKKQTLMFTATLNKYTNDECLRFLDKPFIVRVDDESKLTLYGLKQYYLEVSTDKENTLMDVLKNYTFSQAIVFTNSKATSSKLHNLLKGREVPVVELHAGLKTEERKRILKSFKAYEYRVLISTDLVSRGIDVQDVNLVVNFDMPDDPETYLHRVGRAGRFETEGIAVSFVSSEEEKIKLNEIQSRFEIAIEKSN